MQSDVILVNRIYPTQGLLTYVKNIFLVFLGTILLAISSKIQVPFWPVPMTMQTFVVFLIGMTYSVRLSFLTLLTYLAEGAFGLPVFAAGGGLAYLVGPTAGYLYGMLVAAIVISFFAGKGFGVSYIKTTLTLLLGSIIIFSFGIFYLGSLIGFEKAFQAGLIPFIPSEIFKIALAVSIIPTVYNYIRLK